MQVKTIHDYYEKMYEMFPEVPQKDIKRILKFGWKSVYLHNLYGGDTLITDDTFWCYTGILRNDSVKHFHYYIKKMIIKLRVLYKRKKIQWDGYYYFALTESQYQDFLSQHNKRGRKKKIFTYGNQIIYQILDECKLKEWNKRYIFRIPYAASVGFTTYKPNLTSDKAEQIITREPLKFKDILVSENNYEYL